ncbi:MAG: hypothetical protein IJM37_05345 [Lachnospiraceae bacterium]|nr:hypothetical protein [Lachnospiraceae bacterium]
MSQSKVDKYKEQKANRKEIYAKEQRKKKLTKAAWIGVFVLLLAGIIAALSLEIHSWYVNKYLPSKPDYTAESLVISDLAGVLEDETEAHTHAEDETEAASEDGDNEVEIDDEQ